MPELTTHLTIGEKIRQTRTTLGLSQRRLSDKLNVSAAYIANIERGAQKFPYSRLGDFSNALGVDLAEYYNDRLPPPARKVKSFLDSAGVITENDFWSFVDGLRV